MNRILPYVLEADNRHVHADGSMPDPAQSLGKLHGILYFRQTLMFNHMVSKIVLYDQAILNSSAEYILCLERGHLDPSTASHHRKTFTTNFHQSL